MGTLKPGQEFVDIGILAAVLCLLDKMNMGKAPEIRTDDLNTPVRGSIINHMDGVGLAGLGDDRVQAFRQIGGVIVVGDQNGK